MSQSNESKCNEVPGTLSCAQRNWNKHMNQANGCQGNGECVSFHKSNPNARLDSADAFRQDSATALRHLGYQQNETRKRVDKIGSTGQGLGHLSDAHAFGRSVIPIREQRFPKTFAQ